MDCEKFDEHVIDALYEELDELTAAALRRHTDGCARCSAILAGLKSAREGAVLPLEEPSGDLEARILEAERAAQRRAPWPRKLMRAAAWAGSHAMRPQLAMAALFMLVVGSSLLLLRARPGTVGAPIEVTERGAPSPAATTASNEVSVRGRQSKTLDLMAPTDQKESGAAEPKGLADAERAPAAGDLPQVAATSAPGAPGPMAAGAAAPAAKLGVAVAPGTPQQALSWAREGRASGGCLEAVGRYDAVTKQFPATPEAETASREESECQRQVAAAPSPPTPAKPAEADGGIAKSKPAASASSPARSTDPPK